MSENPNQLDISQPRAEGDAVKVDTQVEAPAVTNLEADAAALEARLDELLNDGTLEGHAIAAGQFAVPLMKAVGGLGSDVHSMDQVLTTVEGQVGEEVEKEE